MSLLELSLPLSCFLAYPRDPSLDRETLITLCSVPFNRGEEHSLHSFQQRDTAFREHWFSTHPPKSKRSSTSNSSGELEPPNGVTQKIGGVDVSEHDVETEFWRLVESQTETVEVEYGADVHSSDHGRCA